VRPKATAISQKSRRRTASRADIEISSSCSTRSISRAEMSCLAVWTEPHRFGRAAHPQPDRRDSGSDDDGRQQQERFALTEALDEELS
jgi:hypothetical protein